MEISTAATAAATAAGAPSSSSSSWLEVLQALDPKSFVASFLARDTRPDGRLFSMCRPTQITTGILQKHTAGSALVKLGHTQVLSGVVLQVGTPSADSGDIQFDNDPVLEQLFRGGSGSGSAVDLSSLLIESRKSAWRLRISCQVLNDDGNADDAKALAVLAALRNTTLLAVQTAMTGAKESANGGAVEIVAQDGDEEDGGSAAKGRKLELRSLPVPLTIGLCRLENHEKEPNRLCLIVDPTLEEQAVLDGTLTMIVDAKDESQDILHLRHAGKVGVGREDLAVSAHMAYERAKEIQKLLQSVDSGYEGGG